MSNGTDGKSLAIGILVGVAVGVGVGVGAGCAGSLEISPKFVKWLTAAEIVFALVSTVLVSATHCEPSQ